MSIVFRNRLEHETFALFVGQNAAFATHAFGHQNSHHTWRPNHSGRMKLNEFHIDEFRTGLKCKRVSISGVFPTVAGDFVPASNPASCEHDCFRPEDFEPPSLAFVPERSCDAVAVLEQ